MSDSATCSADPKAGSTSLHDVILQTWISAFGATKVSYLSGPITTGPLFNSWFSKTGKSLSGKSFSDAKRKYVIGPNSEKLINEANRIREFWSTPIVEPASFFIRGWSQEKYLQLWSDFIEKHVDRILFLENWESSVGCVTEYCRAVEHGKGRVTLDGAPIPLDRAVNLVRAALDQARASDGMDIEYLERLGGALTRLEKHASDEGTITQQVLQKDESLDLLANLTNVAQFVSYRADDGTPTQSFSRVAGYGANHKFSDLGQAVATLLGSASESSVNVRSYRPDDPQSREFVYGIKSVDEAVQVVQRLTSEGLWTVVNETVDVHDGGVSGVYWDDIIEFSPDDTPRAVEVEGVCSLPAGMGIRILETVYGFTPDFSLPRIGRLEFSLHPTPRGWRQSHTIGWEFSPGGRSDDNQPSLQWPNRFSRIIGDKSFGLLVAHEIGLPVPRSLVIARRVAPFSFGRATGTSETWIRTAPIEQEPGKFTTSRGWRDPYRILSSEDPEHTAISAVLSQSGVVPVYSGASIVLADGTILTEGVAGAGDQFMLGDVDPQRLPLEIEDMVKAIHARSEILGPVRFEWVFDGQMVWVVQFHRGQTASSEAVIVAGEADAWATFDPSQGLPALRSFLLGLPHEVGISLTRRIGLTSHIADVIRKAGRPARVGN